MKLMILINFHENTVKLVQAPSIIKMAWKETFNKPESPDTIKRHLKKEKQIRNSLLILWKSRAKKSLQTPDSSKNNLNNKLDPPDCTKIDIKIY